MLQELRDIALKFKIDPVSTVGHAATLETVIKVLSEINLSYKNFLQIEFLKNNDFKKAAESNDKLIETIIKELELLIVDVKFNSFSPSIAPNLTEAQSALFTNKVLAWKKEKFDEYKEDIIKGDFHEPAYIQKISHRYSGEERMKIFQPLLSSIGDGKKYRINILNNEEEIERTLVSPAKEQLNFYIPKVLKEEEEPEYKMIQSFMKVKPDKSGKISINKSSIKEIYYLEELSHQTYPYKPKMIEFNNMIFQLNEKLDCWVSFEENAYIIRNEILDITAWGDTRDEAEESFNFSFYSLYQNFAIEENSKLTSDAINLKDKLNKQIN